MFIAAPLLLFASRPMNVNGKRLAKYAFVLFPFALALCFMLPFVFSSIFDGLDTQPGGIRYFAIMRIFAFGVWTWISCGIIWMLCQWPREPYFPKAFSFRRESVLTVMASMMLIWAFARLAVGMIRDELAILAFALFPLMLFVMISSGAEIPFIPKLARLPDERCFGPVATGVFLAMGLAFLIPIELFLFSMIYAGRLTLDEVGRSAEFLLFWFSMLLIFVLPYLEVARWASRDRSRHHYWVFALPTAIIRLFLLTMAIGILAGCVRHCFQSRININVLHDLAFIIWCSVVLTVWNGNWLSLLPMGFKLKNILHNRGYHWATLGDARLMLWHLHGKAYRVPPAHEYEMIPGSEQNAAGLIRFMKDMIRHRKNARVGTKS
ncbi:hypothetical protein LLG95_10420 [bacterium]|nr:hypothetical protein [bacterium]